MSFKSSINFLGDRLSLALIDGAIQPALKALEEYYPGLALVFSEAATPEAALRRVGYGE